MPFNTQAPNPLLNPTGQLTGRRVVNYGDIPQRNYQPPVTRGPGTPPYSNYRDPYASRATLPNYIGFPSKYPHVLPVESNDPMMLLNSMMRPWLLPRPQPVPAPPVRRPAAKKPPADNSQKNTQQTTPEQPPAIVPGPLSDADVPNPRGSYMGLSMDGASATGHFPASAEGIDPYTDPDINMATRNTRTGTRGGGALGIEALNDMMNLYLGTGRRAEYVPRVDYNSMNGQQLTADNTGYGARIYAETQGVDRNAQYEDMQRRMAQVNAYNEALRQQRGY